LNADFAHKKAMLLLIYHFV